MNKIENPQKMINEFLTNLSVELLYGTGMRLNEVLSLRILDLDFERDEITIHYGKGAASGKCKMKNASLQGYKVYLKGLRLKFFV